MTTFELSDIETYRREYSRLGGADAVWATAYFNWKGSPRLADRTTLPCLPAGLPVWKIGGRSLRRCYLTPMEKPQITAYLKTHCGWSGGVRAVLAKYDLPYTEKDIIQNPAFRWEMESKSGQPLSPCVEVNGEMLSDVSGEEVERYLIERELVQPNAADAGVPINAPCANEEHGDPVKLRL